MALPSRGALALNLASAKLDATDDFLRYFGEVAGTYLLAVHEEAIAATLKGAERLCYNSLVEVGRVTTDAQWAIGTWKIDGSAVSAAHKNSLVF